MKKGRRTTRLVVETERTIIFRAGSATRFVRCAGCAAVVEMAPVAEAARGAGLGELAVYRMVEARSLHFVEDEDGRVLVCLRSLPR